jgi:starvation-inducible DNA-binding protein
LFDETTRQAGRPPSPEENRMKTTTTEALSARAEKRTGALAPAAVMEISKDLRVLLADVFALYVKTKGFHWHITGRHFRDYHLMLDEQAEQIFAMTDEIAERGRKIGGTTLHSIGDIAQHKRLSDDTSSVSAEGMLSILAADNSQLLANLRRSHELCEHHNDFATTSMIEIWIDQTERRVWFLNSTLEPDQTHR